MIKCDFNLSEIQYLPPDLSNLKKEIKELTSEILKLSGVNHV